MQLRARSKGIVSDIASAVRIEVANSATFLCARAFFKHRFGFGGGFKAGQRLKLYASNCMISFTLHHHEWHLISGVFTSLRL